MHRYQYIPFPELRWQYQYHRQRRKLPKKEFARSLLVYMEAFMKAEDKIAREEDGT